MSITPASKLIVVSHCILNPHTVVHGLTKNATLARRLVAMAQDHGVGILQLGCPEFTLLGPRRWAQSYEQYDTVAFRACCETIAERAAAQLDDHASDGAAVVAFVGICGSPSCSASVVTCAPWGGPVPGMKADGPTALPPSTKVPRQGHLTQALHKALRHRNVHSPFLELPPDDCTKEQADDFLRHLEGILAM